MFKPALSPLTFTPKLSRGSGSFRFWLKLRIWLPPVCSRLVNHQSPAFCDDGLTSLCAASLRRIAMLLTSLSSASVGISFLVHLTHQLPDARWCTMMKSNAQILHCACALCEYLLLHINDDVWQDSTLCLHLHLHLPSSFRTHALPARPRASFSRPTTHESGKYGWREPMGANFLNWALMVFRSVCRAYTGSWFRFNPVIDRYQTRMPFQLLRLHTTKGPLKH
jgi:hypothetical protein